MGDDGVDLFEVLGEEGFLRGIGQDIEISGGDGEILHDLIGGAVAFNGINVFDRVGVLDGAEGLVLGAAFFLEEDDLGIGGLELFEIVLAEISVSAAVAASRGHLLNGDVAVVGSLCDENARGDLGSPIGGDEEFAVHIVAGNELHTVGDLVITLVAGAKKNCAQGKHENERENFLEVHDLIFLSVEKVVFCRRLGNLCKEKLSMTDISDLSIHLLLYHKKRPTVNEKSGFFHGFYTNSRSIRAVGKSPVGGSLARGAGIFQKTFFGGFHRR